MGAGLAVHTTHATEKLSMCKVWLQFNGPLWESRNMKKQSQK